MSYSETAVVMDPGQPTIQGRASIVDHNKMFFDANMVKITLTPRATMASGDLGFDEGTYMMEITPKAGGPAQMAEGRYLVVLQRGADGWKVIEDIGNTVAPPPPPPAPPAPEKGKK
jgi:ketosteroid isomerase-like protein